MAWPRGKRRHATDAARFVGAVVGEFSAREVARRCGVSDRTVRRWVSGQDWPDRAALVRLVESLFCESAGALPVYSPDVALDGNTRVGGVGEFSIRASQGDLDYVGDAWTTD